MGWPDPPLPGIRRWRLSGHLVEARAGTFVRRNRRGGLGRRLCHGALALGRAQPALRRIAGEAARLRLRHLHAGAGGGQKGGGRRVSSHPPPLARADQRSRDLGPDPHQAGREVARPSSRDGSGPSGAGAACRGGGGVRQGDHGCPPDAEFRGQSPTGARAAGARPPPRGARRHEERARGCLAKASLRWGVERAAARGADCSASQCQGARDRLRNRSTWNRVVREPRARHRSTANTPSTRSTNRPWSAERSSISASGGPATRCSTC